MPTTLTIMWRKVPTPGLIPLCNLYRPKFGTIAPQRDLLANDRVLGTGSRARLPEATSNGTVNVSGLSSDRRK